MKTLHSPLLPLSLSFFSHKSAKGLEMTTHALVLHSGGLDSSTCLLMANRDYDKVTAVSIDYGQRHYKEINYSISLCSRMGIDHITHKVNLPKSMLTDVRQEIPNVSYEDLPKGVSPTYVPYRNGTFLSHIAALAQVHEGDAVYFGAHSEDARNWAYPDCTPEFIGAMANAIYIGTYSQTRLVTPLQWLCKADIVKLGASLGVPFEETWSCYKGGEKHCGTCPTCRSRKQAFIDAHIQDPTEYEV